MSDRLESFEIGTRPRIEVRLSSGRVLVDHHDAGGVEVRVNGKNADGFTIEQFGDGVSVRQSSEKSMFGGSHRVSLRVPSDSEIDVSVASADVEVNAEIGDLRIAAASGDVSARSISRDLTVKTASGDIKVEQVGGRAQITAASGDIDIRKIGRHCTVSTASGEVEFGEVSGDLRIKTASGDVDVDRFLGAEIECKTVSGDLTARIPSGRRVDVDLNTMTGDVLLPKGRKDASASTESSTVSVRFRSVSGDIRLERA